MMKPKGIAPPTPPPIAAEEEEEEEEGEDGEEDANFETAAADPTQLESIVEVHFLSSRCNWVHTVQALHTFPLP
jgi:hypothetical protein